MNRLKDLRLNAGLSQSTLAKMADTTQRNISYWESGRIELNLYTAIRLAQIFQVDVEFLAGYSDDLGVKPDINFPNVGAMGDASPYSSEERELIKNYRELNAPGKKLVKTVIETQLATMAESKKKDIS